MASQEVVHFDDQQITGMTRYAKAYSGSSFFKDAASVEKAFVLISAGSEIGIAPFASITGISLIQGKPVIGSGILAGLVKAHPRYDYRVRRLDDEGCVIAFFQDGEEIGESSFTAADAKRAKLDSKDVWKNYPRNMYFARAISNGVAFYTPDVTTTRVYVESELDDISEPAPRSARREQTATPALETVVDAEVVGAAPEAATSAEPNSSDIAEGESAAPTTNHTDTVATLLKKMSAAQRKAVREACERIEIPWDEKTPAALFVRFGVEATTLETLLPVLAEAVSVPPVGQADGEVPFGEPSAEAFDAFLEDDTAKNIAAAEKAQDEAAARIKGRERMAKAGSYGE